LSTRGNTRLAVALVVVIAGMTGLAFASVPLYRAFCAATGYGGTPQVGGPDGPGAVKRMITVRFNANTNPGLPWTFEPDQARITLPQGEDQVAFYHATNNSAEPVTGVALYNVTPDVVGKYFHKTACFCFNEQTLKPGQAMEFPLSFWVDPAISKDPETADIKTITLSYTFFRAADDAAIRRAMATAGPHVGPLQRDVPPPAPTVR
jgi:cytochrome c oxidase assembly protein subunit 11